MSTPVYKGMTDQTLYFVLVDSTTGLPKTGLAHTDVTGSFARTRGNRVAITMANLAAPDSAHSDGGWEEVDATNQPGLYRFDIPDAAFATGAFAVVVTVKATGCKTEHQLIPLWDVNTQDGVRAGLTAFPNAAAEAAGGLYTRGTGAGQINQPANGMIDVNQVRLGGSSQSTTDLKDFADDGYDPSTNKIQGLTLADAVTGLTPSRLDVDVSTRLATASYTAPDNVGISTISTNLTTLLARIGGFAGTGVNTVLGFLRAALRKDGGITTPSDVGGTYDHATDSQEAIRDNQQPAAEAALAAYDGPTHAELISEINDVQADVAGVQSDTNDIQTRIPAALASGRMASDAVAISGSTAAADAVEANIGSLDATVSSRLATAGYTAPDNAGIASLLARLGAFAGSGVNTVLGFLRVLGRKDLAAPSDMGGAYDPATDSLEAIRDRGDAAWTTGGGGGGGAVAIALASPGDTLTIQRGDVIAIPITGLGSLAGRTALYITVKASTGVADTDAIIQIEETDGLLRLNKAATTAGWGDIEVTDEVLGGLILRLEVDASSQLSPKAGLHYDVQVVTADGPSTRSRGLLNITDDVTWATS